LELPVFFDAISSAEFEKNGNPDPAFYLRTSQKLNIKPEDCIAIEDSYSGMLAAKKAAFARLHVMCIFSDILSTGFFGQQVNLIYLKKSVIHALF